MTSLWRTGPICECQRARRQPEGLGGQGPITVTSAERIARVIVDELRRQGADKALWPDSLDYVDDSEGLDKVEAAGRINMLDVARAVLREIAGDA